MQTRRTNRRRLFALGAGCVLTGLATSGCTWLDARSNTRVTVNVVAQEEFEPATISISPGTTVVWHNLTSQLHAVTTDASLVEDSAVIVVPEGATPWDSGDLLAGVTWEHTFTEPGTWVYIDRYLGSRMVGVIIVEDG